MSARKLLGIVHVVAAVLLAFTFLFQIADLQIGGSLVPSEYFVYFTNDTTMAAIVLLALTGVSMLRGQRDRIPLTVAALAVVPLAMVTGIVYNLTLRGQPTEVYLGMDWENEVLHVAVPLFLTLDWFVFRLFDRGRPALPWRTLLVALIFPVLWTAMTFTRGTLTGWYPYPFLEPSAGIATNAGYVGGIAVFVVIVVALGILVTRRGRAAPVTTGSAGTR
ncbi:MAG TPA: Pr6Pr family membrane protein [Nocardioidaceae bacterium]|nr:Pr6Pr family membrane protein [Nocardioidaceae bacterium]